jgi:hypothetical protein
MPEITFQGQILEFTLRHHQLQTKNSFITKIPCATLFPVISPILEPDLFECNRHS